jgi:hypothetical protein
MLSSTYGATVAALAGGQIVCWAVLFYAFTAYVLPMQRDTGWSQPLLMGAYTLGLGVSAALSFAVGAAIDRGRGRAVLGWGPVSAPSACCCGPRLRTSSCSTPRGWCSAWRWR